MPERRNESSAAQGQDEQPPVVIVLPVCARCAKVSPECKCGQHTRPLS